jgi:hypothetical protein
LFTIISGWSFGISAGPSRSKYFRAHVTQADRPTFKLQDQDFRPAQTNIEWHRKLVCRERMPNKNLIKFIIQALVSYWQPAVSRAAVRGKKLARDMNLSILK